MLLAVPLAAVLREALSDFEKRKRRIAGESVAQAEMHSRAIAKKLSA